MTKNNNQNEIIQWGCKYLLSHGYTFKNTQPDIVRETPWSFVIRFVTSNGDVYLKQTPRLLALEANIVQLLRDQFHASVPDIIEHNAELNCFLMKDAGTPLRQVLKNKFDVKLLCKGIHQFTNLQLAIANRVDVLLAIGVPDWRLNKLPDLYAQLFSQTDILIADGLSEKESNALETLLPKISKLCEKLASYTIKQTMVQPDFNDNNLLIDHAEKITIVDVGEIVISHPFFSIINFLQQIKKHHGVTEKDNEYQQLIDACFENDINHEPKNRLLEAFSIAKIVFFVYGALANIRLINACGPEKLMAFQPGKLRNELKALNNCLHGC